MKVNEPAVAYKILNPLKKVEAKSTAKVVPVYRWSSFDKIAAIKNGVSKEELEAFKIQAELDYDTLASILNVAKATLHNKKGKAKFDTTISEKIFLLADLYSFGFEVFEDKEKFNQWMKASNFSLGEVAPINMVDTLYGIHEVKNLIGRIAYGVYS